jgi:hypothetical protein
MTFALRKAIYLTAALGGGGTYLIRDEFSDARAAGSVDGTPATPGPGTRAVTDTDGDGVSVGSGIVTLENANSTAGDPGFWLDGIARAAGVAMFTKVTLTSGSGTAFIAMDGDQAGFPDQRIRFSAGNITVTSNSSCIVGAVANGTANIYGIVLRETGLFYLLQPAGSEEWLVLYVEDSENVATNYPNLSIYSRELTADYVRAAQLKGAWTSDYGIATQRLAGARSPGDTFTHEADCLIEFTVATLPSAGQIEMRFRIQDASNYWQVTVDSSGNLDLDEVVAGSPTQRGTDAGHVAGGERVVIIADDEDISVFEANTRRITYGSAANFKTETDGELETEGTGGAVSDIVAYPRVLSGAALSQVEKYTQ